MANKKVASRLNKGHPSSFYNKDKPNPVLLALDQETTQFVAYMEKRSWPGYKMPEGESFSRPADTLFELWNKYEPRLPKIYYQEKLLEMGDFLLSIQEYKLALWQCYERYLQHFGEINVEEITDVDNFRRMFFPGGFEADNAGLTFQALMGKSISMYQVVCLSDPKLQNKQSVERCVHILGFLRLVMQVVLPRESLCWLIVNGSVHVYSIARHLMSMGHSSRVLEYLLWASTCMETSVPLMAVKYLPWRATLYTAVCQCYYDCKAGPHAEAFARRGLGKINELSQLEHLSNSVETPESEFSFRQATVRMAVMVYKRSVFETRRKPKGLLRPKTRANMKEAMNTSPKKNKMEKGERPEIPTWEESLQFVLGEIGNMPWPRTPTEKMLADMFEGGSAQFLAILESLNDSNRRILLTSPPTLDNEPEILDVYAELFMAAQEILAGGGGNRATATKTQMQLGSPPLSAVAEHHSLIDMATRGEDGVPLDCAIRVVKLAYNYEHWDVFDALVDPVLAYIKTFLGGETPQCARTRTIHEKRVWEEKALELLQAMGRLNNSRRHSKRPANAAASMHEGEHDENTEQANTHTAHSSDAARSTGMSTRSMIGQDDLINLADVLMSIVNGPFKCEKIEVDMVIDAALFLWSKCKSVFQKFQTGSIDNPRYLQKMDNPHKWMYLLDSVHQALGWTGISSVDPTLTAEVVLRLAMVYESSAQLESMDDAKVGLKESKTTLTDVGVGGPDVGASHTSLLSHTSRQIACQQLAQAREILRLGLENVNYARTAVALNDGKSIADVSWIKKLVEENESVSGELHPEVFQQESAHEGTLGGEPGNEDSGTVNPDDLVPPSMKGSATAVWNTVKDLHLELILMYHRVTLKLANLATPAETGKGRNVRKSTTVKSSKNLMDGDIESFDELKDGCDRNLLSKSLLFMQRALMMGTELSPSEEQSNLLNEAMGFIQKTQVEEQRTYFENTGISDHMPLECHVPPPPILLCRTNRTMVFRPAPFMPISGEKVAWYRLFGRNAAGSNVKARISDYNLPGSGDEVPSHGCELKVSGLNPNERYVFAVAAYTADGKMIGDSIGETSKPILASHPLPVLMTWAFLSQISYQVGHYPTAKEASEVLWDHFLAEPPPPEGVTFITEAKRDFKLTLLKLNKRAVCLSSPVLLRQFLTSIFINVDISIRQNGLFCDVLCDQGPLYPGQMKRLALCEKMMVAVELAGWLNEASLTLQAVVQCYGLVAPMLYYKIPALPVIQVLQQCHAVLQEIPSGLIQKRQGHVIDSLHHMTACITFHLAKVLRTWGQKTLANNINDAGRRLLSVEPTTDQSKRDDEKDGDASGAETETGSMSLAALKKKKGGVAGGGGGSRKATKEEDGMVNEELRALEAHMMKVSRAAHGEHELNGNEDPSILHAYIAFLPSKLAYREVVKFRRRARYLEFFVNVAQKALTEGEVDQVVDWCKETDDWITKRNESIIGPRAFMSKQVGAITVAGNDPKKFAAAMAEYSKKDGASPRAPKEAAGAGGKTPGKTPASKGKKSKYKPLGVTAGMTEAQKLMQEQQELMALELLGIYFIDMYRNNSRKRRLRRITMEEMPWRCQLNMVQGLGRFGVFLQKLEKREKLLGSSSSNMYRTSFLDHEWLTFETAGTLVVGWEGGPARRSSARVMMMNDDDDDDDEEDRKERLNMQALDLANEDRPKTTGIEFAAAAATGSAPPPLYPIPPEIEDTPRTYRSDFSKLDEANRINPDSLPLSTEVTIEALSATFNFFKRAVVLAHRGQLWTLLQNGARAMWNCLHTAMLRALSLAAEGEEPGLLTMARLNDLAWHPLHTATDLLLDMLLHQETDLKQQAAKAKSKGRVLGSYFESWFGNIKSERGGSSLKFEVPVDDLSMVDARWVRRMVLRCLEMLYYQQKWEKLVDIAMRFSALSNGRYAEQVVPLLVQAQRKVKSRIAQVGGPRVPQPHYRKLTNQLGRLVTARDYLTVQLKVYIDPSRAQLIQPGASIDPMGHNTYSDEDAFRLSSVPLDTNMSLETMRAVLGQSRYTARALHHSRKLLVLYLAGQQNSGADNLMSRRPTKVDFKSNTARPQPTAPPDLSREEFLSMDDVQTSPIPRSQLGHVIVSYEKTIEMLVAKNQKGLAAQALQEVGNIHYHAANIRAAYRCWAESLDIVLGMSNCLHTWRRETHGQEDISAFLLERCGLWGCVVGGVLASNIAQYILTADLGLRMECCFLSGYLFKALFRASLPHPTSDRDYALYDVGEGCEVTNLVPGIDFFSDRFRCNGRPMVAALRWVTEELARGRHNLYVLPLLTLYQYFTTFVCRDVQRCVDGRILKVRVLTDLGLFSEAFTVLLRLIHGERLPHTGDSSFRQTESRIGNLRFNTSQPINDVNNLKILENILDKRMSSHLATLFGPHLTCHLSLAQSHLFVALAETIPVLPAMEDVIFNTDQSGAKTIPTMSRGGKGGSRTKAATDDKKEAEDDDISVAATPRFSDSNRLPTLELIKGTLLIIADQMVTTISEVICDNASHDRAGLSGLASAELELVVLCRLEQAAIAQQKHHAPMAARTILSALKQLQNSDIFRPRKAAAPQSREDAAMYERPSSMKGNKTGRKGAEVRLVDVESNQFQFQNFQSRARLDPRLWLTCRMALVKTLNMEIRGMGEVKGADNKVLTELAECRQYCVEGLKEAEACGDVELQAEFLVQGALLNIMEGRSLEQTVTILEDAVCLLRSISCLSMPAEELLATCIILRTDLEATKPNEVPTDSPTQRTLQAYLQAQDIILGQMEALGERIEHHLPKGQLRHLSVPVSPMENIYTLQVLRLAQLKLRIGHAISRNLAKDIRNGQVEEGPQVQWGECLGVLSTALEIMQVSMRREASTEVEILLCMGKIQKRLVYQGKYQPRAAAATFLEAIKISFANDHDLGLIRQAYLELAFVYLFSCGGIRVKEGSILESVTGGDSGEESSASTKSSVREKKRWKSKKERSMTKMKEEETESEKERRAAWVAIRCAAATAQAMRARGMMIGDTAITAQKVAEKAQRCMPDFAALDMMNPYVLGEKKKVFKNEIEEELAPLIEAQEVKVQETYEDQINKARAASFDLSWIHLLGYQTILQRLCCTATIAASSSPTDTVHESENEGEDNIDFDLGFVSRAQFDLGQNFDVVRYTLFSGLCSTRLNHVHQYLCTSLPQYASDCCAIYPPACLVALTASSGGHGLSDLNIKSYASNLSLNSLGEQESSTSVESVSRAPPPPGSQSDPHKPSDKLVLTSTDSEVCMQWYQPSLEEADPARPEMNPADRRIILLYALSRKGTTPQGSIFPGFLWVSLHKINDLHDRLAVLAQRGEISLVEKRKESATSKPKKAQRIKALSPKMQRAEHLESLLRQCIDDIASVMGCIPEQGATVASEIPFKVSKQNLKSLEQLFDPSLGMLVRGLDLVQWVYKLFP
ncbi:hypothetical protein V1264_021114 [Littorina saxatilis]|uniref:Cilia- and flagella-associated protein 54 n=1 Tax=Littorina saxatilis TaxID=31220 RepID=A0AAN9GCY7_9CAEN